MPTATGLVVIKKFDYRGDAGEEWSNKYWFTGVVPPDDTAWLNLFTAVATSEKACFTPGTNIVRAYGYNNSDEHSPAIWVYDLEELGIPIPGTLTTGPSDVVMAGDQAAMLWWKTSRRNARGKWIYLRKYMHDGTINLSDSDAIGSLSIGPYGLHVLKMMDGTLPGGAVIRSPGQDEVIQEAELSAWVTTRTLKRRGKRKPAVTPPA